VQPALTCREFVDFLDRYLSGELPAGAEAAFNNHLACCPSCVAFMKTYRETQALAQRAFEQENAPVSGVPEELVRAILASVVPGRT